MSRLRGFVERLRLFVQRRSRERDLDAELHIHLAMEADKHVRAGLSLEDARAQAQRAFGNISCVKERVRHERGIGLVEDLLTDVRHTFRLIFKSPGFVGAIVATLALGMGTAVAVFAIVYGALLKPLAYGDPDRLVTVREVRPTPAGTDRLNVAPANFLDWQARSRSFVALAAFRYWGVAISGDGEAERLTSMRTSADFFRVLAVTPLLGREFAAGDAQVGAPPVAILGHHFWARRFGSSQMVIGRTMDIDGELVTIVGVLPADFRFGSRAADVWTPLVFQSWDLVNRNAPSLEVVARLGESVSVRQAQQDMDRVGRDLGAEYPETNAEVRAVITPLHRALLGDQRLSIWLLVGTVGFVFFVACANVGTLLLARAAGRADEVTLRRALGASSSRIIRHALTENVILTMLGAMVGLLVAAWAIRFLDSIGAVPGFAVIGIDVTVLAFTFGLSWLTASAFGLLSLADLSVSRTPTPGVRSTANQRSGRLRSVLVVVQVALAATLIIGTGLMAKSVTRLSNVDPGFDPEGVLTFSVSLSDAAYPAPVDKAQMLREVLAGLRNLPGVTTAGLVSHLPLRGGDLRTDIALPGQEVAMAEGTPSVGIRATGGDYFQTIGIPLVLGRVFTEQDRLGSPPVAVVGAETARRFFAEGVALGQRIRMSADGVERTIVGVVGDVLHSGLDLGVEPVVYVPYFQSPWPTMTLVVRTTTDPETLAPVVRQRIHVLNPNQPVDRIQSMNAVLQSSIRPRRAVLSVLQVAALVAVTLAAIGIYGMMAYVVSRRTAEIGIRVAVGAPTTRVLMMILGQGMRLVAIGLAIGTLTGLIVGRALNAVLFQVVPFDPATFAIGILILGTVALLACALPTWRAVRLDPTAALRCD